MNIRRCAITVTGLVQGIGFRPFIAELAEELGLEGQVKNLGGVVEIILSGDRQAVDMFIHRLILVSKNGELPGCRIDDIQVEEVKETIDFAGKFHIVESGNGRESRRFLPIDLPTCNRCIEEMHDPMNRRYRYPFISCTACGPRFSIQKAVPYDRDTITMDDFKMCEACFDEYTQKGNIRRHAQTIACKDCGPRLQYVTWSKDVPGEKTKKVILDEAEALEQAIVDLNNGMIGAIKDIGGFHFAFSPMNRAAAQRLREFKNRDKKPFAVMFLDIESIREYCYVSEKEEELLLSSARPIVLLQKKKDFVPEICGESDRIGALLPCNPLQTLILEETGPLVMTSGNRGGEPIIISDDEMEPYVEECGIDFMLTHDREILTPLDDSIFQVTEILSDVGNQKKGITYHSQLIRRARGLVPEPICLNRKLAQDSFAAGGDLKATFALGRDELVYMSQYFGDLEDVRCMESRKKGKMRMEYLLEMNPQHTVGDLHPAYISAQDTTSRIQHHHAHVASVIAEHGLEGKVLGIACDGTGFGTDGTIWGSEFLLCEDENMTRIGHFSTVKLLGGDASAKQADMTLFSYMLEARERGYDVDTFFIEKNNSDKKDYTLQEMAWKQNINTAYSSSMGRLFDVAAALLDICHYNSYEGECAIVLEQMAHKGRKQLGQIQRREWNAILTVDCMKIDGIWKADSVKLLVDMLALKEQYTKEVMAYLFHHAIAEAIIKLVELIGVDQIALSGGTFINRILLSEVMAGLQAQGKSVYINEKVPCGDGGLALGQMYLATFEN